MMRGGRDLPRTGIYSWCRVGFALVGGGRCPLGVCIKVCMRYGIGIGCYPLCKRSLTYSTLIVVRRVGVSLSGKVAPAYGPPFPPRNRLSSVYRVLCIHH